MNWYIIFRTLDRDKIGKADNQSSAMRLFESAKYIYEPVPMDLKPPQFKLHHHAKLTDLVQSLMTSDYHPLISTKFLDCLRSFKTVPTSCALPTMLIDKKGEELPYYVYVQQADFNAVDYLRSVFCKPAGFNEKWIPIYEDIESKPSCFREVIDQGGVGARALYIYDDISWDFFVLAGPPFLWMARDYVVHALQDAEITGLCYIPFHQGDDFVNDDMVSKALRIEQPNRNQ